MQKKENTMKKNSFLLILLIFSFSQKSFCEKTKININTLWNSLEKGETKLLKKAEKNDFDFSKEHPVYRTNLLFLAVKEENYEASKLLLKKGVSPDTSNTDGQTILQIAALKENEKLVNLILQHKPNVTYEDNDGRTVLHCAAATGNKKLLKKIKEHTQLKEMNLNQKDIKLGWTALHFSVFVGDANSVAYLLKEGARVDLQDRSGQTPFHLAIELKKSKSITKLLLLYKASIHTEDLKGETPISYACKGYLEDSDYELKMEESYEDYDFSYSESDDEEFNRKAEKRREVFTKKSVFTLLRSWVMYDLPTHTKKELIEKWIHSEKKPYIKRALKNAFEAYYSD